jgi:pimeloyl-ACP methyl ester carboxylesterase
MTHGWPSWIVELMKVGGPLTDPTAPGGHAEDAFDLMLPSLPGYGFSGKPLSPGWGPDRIARARAELMGRLDVPTSPPTGHRAAARYPIALFCPEERNAAFASSPHPG